MDPQISAPGGPAMIAPTAAPMAPPPAVFHRRALALAAFDRGFLA